MSTDPAPRRIDAEQARLLLVDDEPAVVAGLRRHLHGRFIIETATSGAEALELMDDRSKTFAVVVSDMQMPGMDGATLLKYARERSPSTVRVLLTGQADLNAAVAAINDGRIFRFMWKPCEPQNLLSCIQDAVLQHQLMISEKELQERTLRASIRALLDTLGLANPTGFARADRIKRRVVELATAMEASNVWQIEIASMLAQVGTVTLPQGVVERLHRGDRLIGAQQELVDQLPQTSVDVIAGIPRLQTVRDMITLQRQRYDGKGHVTVGMQGQQIPLGARVLAVATGYDPFEAQGAPAREGIAALRSDAGQYDPAIIDALEILLTRDDEQRPVRKIQLAELAVGMVLAADVTTTDGVMLCGQGQEVTARVLDRLHNWSGVVEPLAIWPASAS